MITKDLNKILKITFLTVVLSFVSCDDKQFYDTYQSTKGDWNKADVKEFIFEQTDTLKPYNLFVNIRNNSDYPYANLFLIVKMTDPAGGTIVDTLQYQMANADGSLLGNGFTDFKENKLFYRENYKFPKSGKYKIQIEHAVRANGSVNGDSLLKGISDIGFRVENSN